MRAHQTYGHYCALLSPSAHARTHTHTRDRSPLTSPLLQIRKNQRPCKPRASLQPGTVLILLAGRFRGKRVVLLKNLAQGVLLVTGPFKVNGVPLRRVNARYVIATSTKVDITGIDSSVVEKVGGDAYFAREKKSKAKGEDAFFKQGEKPEVRSLRRQKHCDMPNTDTTPTGQEGRLRPRRGPEVRRPCHPLQPQEGAFPHLLPRLHLQPQIGRQAPRDGLLSDLTRHTNGLWLRSMNGTGAW